MTIQEIRLGFPNPEPRKILHFCNMLWASEGGGGPIDNIGYIRQLLNLTYEEGC